MPGVECQLEYAVGLVVPYLAVGRLGDGNRVETMAPRPGDELSYTARVGVAVGVLRRETLVEVGVPGDDKVSAYSCNAFQNGLKRPSPPTALAEVNRGWCQKAAMQELAATAARSARSQRS